MNRFRRISIFAMIVSVCLVGASFDEANADTKFRKWISDFYSVAAQSGISKSTYNAVFAGVTEPDPDVMKSANYQPEFVSKMWDYLDARITSRSIETGMEMKKKYKRWLDIIERKYGVDRHILLAIWSMETSYGAALEKDGSLRSVARSLATLAYADPKRRKFARKQLVAAMKIAQNGDISASGLRGSWAGAMGHTQFIPTSFLAWAVDIDGDGRRDIWNSVPDALASAANLLVKNGWRSGKTWGYEVIVPDNVNPDKFGSKSRNLAEWSKFGIRRVSGKRFPRPDDKANLKVFTGRNGPAFLMLKNFFVLKRYNNADKYALAVGHLADRIRGGDPFVQDWPRGYKILDDEEKKELQVHLTRLGLYDGEIDGNIGSGSRAAIKIYQKRNGLDVDGFASKKLLASIRGN